MDTVPDIFDFAAAHADYWTEILSGADYGSILSGEEIRAIGTAREHIEEGICALFVECGTSFVSKLGRARIAIATKNFRWRRSIERMIKYRTVCLDPPAGWSDRLYRFEFGLSPDKDNRSILLYGSLVVKKRSCDKLIARLAKNGVSFEHNGYYIYGGGLSIKRDEPLAALAKRSADTLGDLFLALR